MGMWKSIKSGLDTVFYIRPKKWVSWDFLTDNTKKNVEVVKDVFTIEKAKRKENFTQAMHRFGLTEKDLAPLRKRYLLFAYFFLTIALGIFFYGIQGLLQQYYGQFFGSLCLTLFVCSLAFRYHFWAFQIESKKLGCTLKQWWDNVCS